MSEQTAEVTQIEQVTVFEIGASVEMEVDTGFLPYMEYLDSLRGKPPAFGTRNNSRKKLAMWAKAHVPADRDPQAAAQDLAAQLAALVEQQLAVEGVPVEDPNANLIVSTKVATEIGGGQEW